MRATLFFGILLAVILVSAPDRELGAQGPVPASAVLDEWGGRVFPLLGNLAQENALHTHIRTTIAQLAMFDAVNAVVDGPYWPFASKPVAAPGASPEAAAIRAAYIVALHEFPSTLRPTIDSAYAISIASAGSGPAINDGIAVGEAAANAVLAMRIGDNRDFSDLQGYTPVSGPGAWNPTPPAYGNPQTPLLRFVTPFGYDDPARFRPEPPPALDSKTYTADYNESKEVGSLTSTRRTDEQSATANFWSPSASALWTANIRSLARSMDLLNAARFEAIGIAAVSNALIAAWDAKFTYMFWRPVTAIRADTDGNPGTEPDSGWTPFIDTPPHPEYPAAHTTVGGAALGFYTVWAGTDQFLLPFAGKGAIRYYTDVRQIQIEEGNARVWGGMHWRHSTAVGSAVGSRVGKYTATHLLKPLDN
jgi:hypothetical protein